MRLAPYEIKNKTVVVYLQFDFDLYNSKEFKDYLIKLIEEQNFRQVILNLEQVKYLDSSGTGALVNILQKTAGKVKLRLCCMQETVLKVLKLAHLERIFQIDSTESESLANISK